MNYVTDLNWDPDILDLSLISPPINNFTPTREETKRKKRGTEKQRKARNREKEGKRETEGKERNRKRGEGEKQRGKKKTKQLREKEKQRGKKEIEKRTFSFSISRAFSPPINSLKWLPLVGNMREEKKKKEREERERERERERELK